MWHIILGVQFLLRWFYNPKFIYACIHGLSPLTFIFFQITVEVFFLKKHFLEDVRALDLYFPHTYAFYTTTSHVHMHDAPLLHIILVIIVIH